MAHPKIETGMYVVAKSPIEGVEGLVATAQDQQHASVFIWDHIQDFFPSAIWHEEFSWLAAASASPHEWFEFQTVLGYLAAKFPDMQLGVGVTEPIRRHPLILAQAALTLAHLSRRPPILGIGAGERLGTVPHGLSFSRPVSRLEEALRILRLCLDTSGPIDFEGTFFQLQGAVLDLPVPEGRKPEIWVAAHGPRMLELAGRYGDGWYPVVVASPDDYAARLDVVRAAARSAGRNPDAITPAMHPFVFVAPTEDEASAMLDTEAVRFMGLLFPHEVWQAFGLQHPLGNQFRGYVDILPETYDRPTIEAAIAKVPREMMELTIWGSTEQVIARLQAFGEAGLRHVVPLVASPVVSPEAAVFSVEAMGEIARALSGSDRGSQVGQVLVGQNS